MATINTGDDLFGVAALIVDPTAGSGTHTTIAAALTAATSGQTIFIRPGTYTENPTLVAGVNLTAFTGDGSLNTTSNVIIKGKCTMTTAGTVNISGIQLQTNSDFFLAVTGSANSVVFLENCYLNALNNTGISYTSSGASSKITCFNCAGDVGTTGIAPFSHSGAGPLGYIQCNISNSGNATTACTVSSGSVSLFYTNFSSPITTSSTGGIGAYFCTLNSSATNTLNLTIGGSGSSEIVGTYVSSGTASAITITSTLSLHGSFLVTSNTNGITGAGTLISSSISNIGSSSAMSVSTNTLRTSYSGGISFDKGTNTLNAYTVGTWTPAITPSGTAYTSIGYSTQAGYYTRIGNLVTATCFVVVNAITVGAATGDALISGLPITSNNASNIENLGALRISNVTLASTLWVQGILGGNVTSITMQKFNTAAAAANVAASTITSTTDCATTITYRV